MEIMDIAENSLNINVSKLPLLLKYFRAFSFEKVWQISHDEQH